MWVRQAEQVEFVLSLTTDAGAHVDTVRVTQTRIAEHVAARYGRRHCTQRPFRGGLTERYDHAYSTVMLPIQWHERIVTHLLAYVDHELLLECSQGCFGLGANHETHRRAKHAQFAMP